MGEPATPPPDLTPAAVVRDADLLAALAERFRARERAGMPVRVVRLLLEAAGRGLAGVRGRAERAAARTTTGE
jgi:hypothetical protein